MLHVTYPAEGFDCEGNCLSGDAVTINGGDSYGDGGGSVTVGGGTEILSCWCFFSNSMC